MKRLGMWMAAAVLIPLAMLIAAAVV